MARFTPRGRAEERIVGRDGAVAVEPQDLAEAGVEALGVGADGVVADGDVELAVLSKVDRAAVVVRGAAQRLHVQIDEDDLAPGSRDVAAGGEPADAVVNVRAGRGVVDVYVLVAVERRIERDAEDSALADGVDRQREKRLVQQRAVLDDADLPGLEAHEQPAVRRKRHRGRIGQAADDQALREAGRQRRRVRGRTHQRPRACRCDHQPADRLNHSDLPVTMR